MVLLLSPCSMMAEGISPEETIARDAVDFLIDEWDEIYRSYFSENGDSYRLRICDTRVVRLKEDMPERQAEYFGDIRYIVEFLLYDDLVYARSGAPSGSTVGYYTYSGLYNKVSVAEDGSMRLYDAIGNYRGKYYDIDCRPIIDEVTDFGEQFNQEIVYQAK